MKYRVVWMIDVEAESPHSAAEIALQIQRDPKSKATTFDVIIPPKYPNVETEMITVKFEEVEK